MALREHLSPLRDRGFATFFVSDLVSTAGSAMSAIALPFAVLAVDGSATALGLVAAAYSVPLVGLMLLGGAIADRVPRGPLLRTCTVVLFAGQGTTALLVLTGTARVWELAALQFVAGTAIAVAYPAYHGMVPILLPEVERKSAYLLISQSEGLIGVVGPALAGVLVATAGPGWGLAADAMTFGVAAVLLTGLRLPFGERPERQASVIGDFRAGWAYARGLGWVIPASTCALVFNAMISGGMAVLGPVIARDTIGSAGLGLARGIGAVGGLLMTVVLIRISIRRPLWLIMFCFATAAAPLLVLGLAISTPALAAAYVVFSAGMATLSLAWSLLVQQKVREDMLSRIMAIDGFFSFVAMPIGEIIAGPLAHAFGARDVEVGFALVCVLVLLYSLCRPVITGVRLDPAAPTVVAVDEQPRGHPSGA